MCCAEGIMHLYVEFAFTLKVVVHVEFGFLTVTLQARFADTIRLSSNPDSPAE